MQMTSGFTFVVAYSVPEYVHSKPISAHSGGREGRREEREGWWSCHHREWDHSQTTSAIFFWTFHPPLLHISSFSVLSVSNFDQLPTPPPPNCRRSLWTAPMTSSTKMVRQLKQSHREWARRRLAISIMTEQDLFFCICYVQCVFCCPCVVIAPCRRRRCHGIHSARFGWHQVHSGMLGRSGGRSIRRSVGRSIRRDFKQ